MSTDPSHTVWDDEEAEREAALASGELAEDDDGPAHRDDEAQQP
ncbi:hypothetical protein LP422_24190 [Janibacter limosus]|nr:hypothetical protein [Janibacter limosus]WKV15934.1 hypothetical protein LP422_24190 [Janibacter limosus]